MDRAAYRIIDANFNRAREAIRVIEEFCRFSLNNPSLSGRAKELRHQLCRAADSLDVNMMLCSRDTSDDVGIGQVVQGQLSRENIFDCLIAACRRLTEALRALSEFTQTQDKSAWQVFEQLRYKAYILQKDIVLFGKAAERFEKVRLYVIISSNDPEEVKSLTNKCIGGGADCIGLRANHIEDARFLPIAKEFVQICRGAGIPGIIYDRIDIAVIAGADGVHLGQNDLPVKCVQKLQTSPMIIGKSVNTLEQLKAAILEQPAYITIDRAISAIEKLSTRALDSGYIEEALTFLHNTGIAGVVAGDITPENIDSILAAGVSRIAICSDVANVDNLSDFCRVLKGKILDFYK
jgi:thiamine-phosphate pyrophosphorylase